MAELQNEAKTSNTMEKKPRKKLGGALKGF
jgi:hypothetical protein